MAAALLRAPTATTMIPRLGIDPVAKGLVPGTHGAMRSGCAPTALPFDFMRVMLPSAAAVAKTAVARASVPAAPAGRDEARLPPARWASAEPVRPAALADAPPQVAPAPAAAVQKTPILGVERECEAIARAHRKPKKRRPAFASDRARASAAVESEIDFLVPLLPAAVATHMLSGELGARQVRGAEARERQLRRILAARAGTEGNNVAAVRKMLCVARQWAARNLPEVAPAERDAALFPMSAALAHELVFAEHERATTAGAGSKRGATVGDAVRTALYFAANKLLWPVDAPSAALEGAAPKPTATLREKAGTVPIAAKCHLEALARLTTTDVRAALGAGATAEGALAARLYARSLLGWGRFRCGYSTVGDADSFTY